MTFQEVYRLKKLGHAIKLYFSWDAEGRIGVTKYEHYLTCEQCRKEQQTLNERGEEPEY